MAQLSQPNPYVGPYPFSDKERLYGREAETRQLLNRLIADRIVLMYSPSGAGKTSLIQASLLPLLRDMQFIVHPIVRVNLDLGPGHGADHNRYLLSAMTSVRGVTESTMDVEDLETQGFAEFLDDSSVLDSDHPVEVLVFDQFEEILTLDPTDGEAKRRFFAQLGAALQRPTRWALFSMREEYVAALDPYRRSVPGRLASSFRLDLLHRDAAVEAMIGPAREVGVEFERDAAAILADQLRSVKVQHPDGTVTEGLGAAVEPVQLQVVCRRLWELPRIDPTRITSADVGALDDDARSLVDSSLRDFYSAQVESVAMESPTPERQIRRWIGDALVSQTGVRLTVLREPDSTAGLDNAMVNALIDARLLREDWAGGRAWVELSHDRLVGPVMSDNESWFAAHLHPLQRGAVAWEPTRSDSLLLRGSDYMDAVRWVEETKPELLPVEREYLAASEELAEQERRDRRRRMVIFALLLIALVAAFLAWQNGQNARRQEELAISRQLSVEATAENTREDVGLLLALEAYRFDESLASAGAVMSTLEEHPHVVRFLHGHKAPVVSIEFSPDGTLLAAGGENHKIWVFSVESGEPVEGAPLEAHQSPVFGLAFSPDGSVLASSDDTGRVRLWDVQSLTPLGDEWEVGDGPVRALDFHPTEANLLATGDPDGSISIRDIRDLGSGPVRTMQGHDPGDGESVIVRSIDFSPDGSLLASGGNDGQVRLWDTVTGDQIGDPGGDHEAIVRAVVFNPSPDRRTIASAGNDEMVILWSWDDETGLSRALGVDGADLPKMEGHTERIYALAYAPDGNLLASASRDGTVLLWDTSTGTRHLDQNREQTSPLSAHSGAVRDLAFSSLPSAAGPVLATASNDRTVIISEPLRPNRLGVRLATGSTKLLALAQHPEQPYFVSVVGEASLQTWDAATLQGVGEPMTGFIGTVRSMAYDDAGTQLASGGDDCTVHVWSPETGRRIAQLLGHTRSVTSIAFAAEADQLISVAQDGKVLLWDVASGVSEVLMGRTESGGTIHVCGPDSSGVEGLATYDSSNSTSRPASAWFTPDGAWLVVAWNDGSYRVWPWENGRPGDMSEISEFDITAMPRHLGDEGMAVALEGDEILVWSRLDGWAPLDAPPEPDLRIVSATATGVALGPLGSLVSGGGDGMFRVWDLASGGLVGEPVATGAPVVSVIGFETPSTLITLGQSDNLIVWDIDVEEWTSRICPIANKNLEDEWKQYIPSRPYRDTCPTATS